MFNIRPFITASTHVGLKAIKRPNAVLDPVSGCKNSQRQPKSTDVIFPGGVIGLDCSQYSPFSNQLRPIVKKKTRI